MSVQVNNFGEAQGKAVRQFILTNADGLMVSVINLGAIITQVHLPDRDGNMADVVHGFDNLEQYLAGHPCFGSVCGRVANRIAAGRFTLDGREYQLPTPNGPNHLHGADHAFHKVVWDAEREGDNTVKLMYLSPDGEDGFPGNLTTTILYTLTDANELKIEMTATTDAPTIVNLAQHTYWNLAGHDCKSAMDHQLKLYCDRYTPADAQSIPTGEIVPVADTVFDFTNTKPLGRDIDSLVGTPQRGYDHNFVIEGRPGELRQAAELYDPTTGRGFELRTTQPSVQLYTANNLDGSLAGKGCAAYEPYSAVCLETQHYPDSPNHPNFPAISLYQGQTYRHDMLFTFTIK